MDLPCAVRRLFIRQSIPYLHAPSTLARQAPRILQSQHIGKVQSNPHRTVTTSSTSQQQAAAVTPEPEEPDTPPSPPQTNEPPPSSQFSRDISGIANSGVQPQQVDRNRPPSRAAIYSDLGGLNRFVDDPSAPRRGSYYQGKRSNVRTEKMFVPQQNLKSEDVLDVGDLQAKRAERALFMASQPVQQDLSAPPFRMGPSLGRTVGLAEERDVGRAFRQLEGLCSRNSVRADFNKQRFHERPGLKRKRLASQRWRRRFKADFQAVCRRVEELRRKGW